MQLAERQLVPNAQHKKSPWMRKLIDSKYLLMLMVPSFIVLLLFTYLPMWGVLYSFFKYVPAKGIFELKFVGLKYFAMFFDTPYAFRIIKNTFLLSLYSLLWGFSPPIIFALILNEIKTAGSFRKIVQTISYLPNFISVVVVCGMLKMFLTPDIGFLSNLFEHLGLFGGKNVDVFADAKYFRTIYIASGIWQHLGWSSILYISAISNIDPGLYEAAIIDGASRMRRVFSITIPSISPTIITILLLSVGGLLSVGFEKVFLLQVPANYSSSDVIQTFVYRVGLVNSDFSYGTAVGLLNALVSLVFLIMANYAARRYSETSLW